ncbi:fumarylacetoacetate hydrolase family protein [Nesterenkonia sp. CL21]|uniref:fumarylacetoacetate hydrolase family protein n=1 Tax=Nesterenkonia sp. CL21 TaxID=3064894 RepID=UPI00287877FE|nr:fumarylacetoacetate hydrolase family protein [Nesterenkonia sp. CL21]MDS2173440.1 fumarylacetoacetate hydrolase family protein [Nesterenkonia sp. CL21]
MKVGRWRYDGRVQEGFIRTEGVVAFPEDLTMSQVIAGGVAAAREACERTDPQLIPWHLVTLVAPLEPASIRDFVAFEEHVEGVSAAVDGRSQVVPEWYEAPTFYFTNPHTVLGTGELMSPPVTERLDFELELAAVVGGVEGSEGTSLTPDEAEDHIFGYTVMNDWSARDLQSREMRVRLGPCKGKDFGTTLGPWIVTADELNRRCGPDGRMGLRAEVYVNGELVGQDLTSHMGWTFPELVAYASRNSVVRPGDVLGSGTVGNGGCLAELWGRRGVTDPPPLVQGDTVTMWIEGVGEITNVVGAARPAPPIRSARSAASV